MYFGFGLLCVYLLVGGLIARAVDRDQMKEDVPYGSASSLLPLRFWRIAMIFFGMFIAVPIVVVGTPLILYENWKHRYLDWRYSRGIRELKRYVVKKKTLQEYDLDGREMLRIIKKTARFAEKLQQLKEKEKQDGDNEAGSISTGGSAD